MTLTSGWSTIALPTSPPEPVTTLTTPSGRPPSQSSSTKRTRQAGVSRRGLDHRRVAADERREQLPGRDGDREVPGRDDPDHADRPADGHRELVGHLRRHGLAEQAAPLAGHVVRDVDRLLHVAARLGQDLAHLAGHEPRELFLVLGQEARDAEEDLAALRRRHGAPAGEGALAAATAASTSAGPGGGELADHVVVVGRADAGEGGARRGGLPVAADQVLVLFVTGMGSPRAAWARARVGSGLDSIPTGVGLRLPNREFPGCAGTFDTFGRHGGPRGTMRTQLKNRRVGFLIIQR